jgi:hypothetical protein
MQVRLGLPLAIAIGLFLIGGDADASRPGAVVSLTFDAPVAGTTQDTNCDGTGFTHRLPVTGWNLPACDPNLDLGVMPGRLTVTSTHFDISTGGVNLDIAETLGVKLTAIGTADFSVSALFRDVHISELSDQLDVYVATDDDHVFRAGAHHNGTSREYDLAQSLNGTDFGLQSLGTFDVGDDIQVTVTRTGGSTYLVDYKNLTNPANSAWDSVTFHWLDTASDLYVGILYANNAGKVPDNPKTSQVDEFTVGIPAVGGIAELPDVSGSSAWNYVAVAGGLAASVAIVTLATGAWYTRRRRIR